MAPDWSGPNRRRYPRVHLNLLVQYRFDTFEDFVAEYASDISEGGIFIRCDEPRPVGSMIYLQFYLKDGTKLIEGLGRVARVIPDGASHGVGVEFVNFDEDSMAMIQTIVQDRKESTTD